VTLLTSWVGYYRTHLRGCQDEGLVATYFAVAGLSTLDNSVCAIMLPSQNRQYRSFHKSYEIMTEDCTVYSTTRTG
jgi:hypothetical protein